MSDLKQCREAFEYWFSDEGESPRAIIRSGDSYRLAAACSAWNAWQACWAARTQPEATAPAQDLSAAILAKPVHFTEKGAPLYTKGQLEDCIKDALSAGNSLTPDQIDDLVFGYAPSCPIGEGRALIAAILQSQKGAE